MARTSVMERMLKAAETWGREYYREDVRATEHTEPWRDADGRLTAVVDLERPSGEKVGQVQCSVIMEPDGKLSCLPHRQ